MSDCSWSNATTELIQYASTTIMLPYYLIIGTVCNVVLLIAFYKQAKEEGTYNYQVLLTVSKTLEVVTFGTYLLGQDWFSGLLPNGAEWFQKSYFLMFATFKVLALFPIHFIISSVLLATAMAADRVFALALPLLYRKINYGRHQVIAALVCFTLPAMTSISFAWFWELSLDGDKYSVKISSVFTASFIGQLCSKIGILLRLVCVAALVILNVIMILLFQKFTKNIAKMTNQEEIIEARKSADRSLLILNVSQSILMCVNQIPHVSLHVLLYTAPKICFMGIASPLADATIFISDSIDLLVVMCVNKKMRGMVKRVIGWRCSGDDQTEAPAGTNGSKQAWTEPASRPT